MGRKNKKKSVSKSKSVERGHLSESEEDTPPWEAQAAEDRIGSARSIDQSVSESDKQRKIRLLKEKRAALTPSSAGEKKGSNKKKKAVDAPADVHIDFSNDDDDVSSSGKSKKKSKSAKKKGNEQAKKKKKKSPSDDEATAWPEPASSSYAAAVDSPASSRSQKKQKNKKSKKTETLASSDREELLDLLASDSEDDAAEAQLQQAGYGWQPDADEDDPAKTGGKRSASRRQADDILALQAAEQFDDFDSDEFGDDEFGDEDDEDDASASFETKARIGDAKRARIAAESEAEMLVNYAGGEMLLPDGEAALEEGNVDERLPLPVPEESVRERIDRICAILADFKRRREPNTPRKKYVSRLQSDLQDWFGCSEFFVTTALQLFSPSEAVEFLTASDTGRPLTIRVNTLKTKRRDCAQALINRGMNVDPLGSWTKEGLVVFESPVPVGATPEYLAGHYILQGAASMLPVISLAPQPGERVLDMCSAPGGKTTHLAALMRNQGILFANDVSKDRLAAVKANAARLGVRNALVCNYSGTDFPSVMGGFDRVLLDAPCTGLGVASHDPAVKASRDADDVEKCGQLQRKLLLAAIDSTDARSSTGGFIVYSTCSISIEENEAVVEYALEKRHIKIVETGLPLGIPGFIRFREKRFHPSLSNCRRVYPHTHNMDGFFVCKIQKLKHGVKKLGSDEADVNDHSATDAGLNRAPEKKKRKQAEMDEEEDGEEEEEENLKLTVKERHELEVAKRKAEKLAAMTEKASKSKSKKKKKMLEQLMAKEKAALKKTQTIIGKKRSFVESDEKDQEKKKKNEKKEKKEKKKQQQHQKQLIHDNDEDDDDVAVSMAKKKKKNTEEVVKGKDLTKKKAKKEVASVDSALSLIKAPFIPAASYAGRKQGYVFQKGRSGLGYYLDKLAASAVATPDSKAKGRNRKSAKIKKAGQRQPVTKFKETKRRNRINQNPNRP